MSVDKKISQPLSLKIFMNKVVSKVNSQCEVGFDFQALIDGTIGSVSNAHLPHQNPNGHSIKFMQYLSQTITVAFYLLKS